MYANRPYIDFWIYGSCFSSCMVVGLVMSVASGWGLSTGQFFFWKAMNSSISEISPLLGGFSNTSVAFSPYFFLLGGR